MGSVRLVIGTAVLAACAHHRPANELAGLVGVWDGSNDGLAGVHSKLEIEASGSVTWEYSECFAYGSGTAVGTYQNGSVMLSDTIVSKGEDWGHRRLRHARIDGREYFVSDGDLTTLQQVGSEVGPGSWRGFRRRLPKPVLQRRIAATSDDDQRALLLVEWSRWPIAVDDIGFLERLAGDDPCQAVRIDAIHGLARIGLDENWEVADSAAAAAAEAAQDRALAKSRQWERAR